MSLWTKTDNDAGKPKNLSATEKSSVIGVEIDEAQQTANRAKGIKTPGWVKTTTYTDAQGKTRNKTETLVAFGGNFAGGDNDTVDPDPVITIGTQPANVTIAANTPNVELTIAATVTRGATATYQWQRVASSNVGIDPLPWLNIADAVQATLNTGEHGIGDNGTLYRCIVSAVGATTVTSATATVTVTE